MTTARLTRRDEVVLGARWARLCLAALLLAALAPAAAWATVLYVEQGGRVVVEAELFTSRTTMPSGDTWLVVADEAPNGSGGDAGAGTLYSNARGGRFVQSLPDDNAGTGSPSDGPFIEYQVLITTTGEYRLYTRWQGHGGNSDSVFFSVAELVDGTGGGGGPNADWYEDTGHGSANFSNDNWDSLGGKEQDQAGASQNPMVWTITTPGIYTIRAEPREDGASLDAFIFQLSSLSAPSGYGPARSPLTEAPNYVEARALAATADAYVRSGSYDDGNFGSDPNLVLKRDTSWPNDYHRRIYLRFDGFPVVTPESLVDAKLELTATSDGGNWRMNVYGLVDGHTGEGWDESLITWSNAPGNATGSSGGDPLTTNGGVVPGEAVFLGQIDLNGVVAGDKVSLVNLDTAGALLDFLLSDSDGSVTFILTRMEADSPTITFASRENSVYDPPMLILYLLPEPGSLALLCGGLVALAARRRKRQRPE